MESYSALKHLHVTAAYLSIIFFVLRAFWSVNENSVLKARWVKIAPHVIDTALLAFGVALAVLLNFWPLPGWLTAKIVALVTYILLGTVAIKRGATPASRALFAVAAVVVFAYILGAANQHSALSWLAAM
ncbi:SirB2 family protein [Halomonas garicola]|uniref:SirB2 family protein n=1 Tax=Halomonas garicola TaxID=1690008 RepID=UPI00289A8B71|nr:SirB2 family protein [Halomonas garicola]